MGTWEYRNPPVWEAAVGASLRQATLYDHYEVADIHKLFSDQFPRAERQPPMMPLQLFRSVYGDSQAGDAFEYSGALPARWWFTTEDSRNVLQLQDDFIGRNWRRTDQSAAPQQGYPGFEGLLADVRFAVDKFNEFNKEKYRSTPDPAIFDVVYVNHLFASRGDGSVRRFRDIAPWMNFTDDIRKGDMSVSWFEGGSDFSTSIRAHFVGVKSGAMRPDGGEDFHPALRFEINARGECASWPEFYEKCATAHDYMRGRLLALTSEEVQATWL